MLLRTVSGGVALGLALAVAYPAYAENVLRWASQGDALTYDPHAQNEGPTNTANQQTHDPLIRRMPSLEMVPGLATSWEAISDTTWELRLREGVSFHDGRSFTAADAVFSLNRARSANSDFKNYISSVVEVEAVDDHTIHIHTSGPTPILPDQLTEIVMMSKSWAEEHDVVEVQDYSGGEETFAVRNANGTGPFRVELREPEVRTVLVRNDDWWGLEEYPHNLDRIVYTPISSAATRVAALLSGEVDFLLDPPLQDLERIRATDGLTTQQVPQIRTIFLGLDVGRDALRTADVGGGNPFSDVRVRQAMAHALDLEAIQSRIMRGLSEPAGIITSPGVHGYTKDLDQPADYDPDRAKELLAEAGYEDGFQVRLDCPNDRYINDEAICQAVVGMLARVGIQVDLDAQTRALHFPKIQNRESDFYLLGWGVPTLDSHYVFNFLYHTDGGWNATGYSNPRIDELTEAMDTEIDLAKRNQMIAEAWQIVKEDMVYIPIHHQVIVWAMKDHVDLPIDPQDKPSFALARLR
jgi:peptide/nickel transport system substrate-binding protein